MEYKLPVSLGEAIDKLTILDIKLDKIKDDRRLDVQKEYDLLYEILKESCIQHAGLYKNMKTINCFIWEMMDVIRDSKTSETEYLKTCKDCIEYNDIRFRIKNKINYLSNSHLKEQKGYKRNQILIRLQETLNTDDFVEPIKYFSYLYDRVCISSKNESLKELFRDDPTIEFEESGDSGEYKKIYSFMETNYRKEDIYEIFQLENSLFSFLQGLPT